MSQVAMELCGYSTFPQLLTVCLPNREASSCVCVVKRLAKNQFTVKHRGHVWCSGIRACRDVSKIAAGRVAADHRRARLVE